MLISIDMLRADTFLSIRIEVTFMFNALAVGAYFSEPDHVKSLL
jgi:hypothetical protein